MPTNIFHTSINPQRSNVEMYFIMLILMANSVYSLTCNEVMNMGDDKKTHFLDLQTMNAKDVTKCVLQLGRSRLDIQEAEFIWKAIVEEYEGISNIPEDVLMHLNWITIAIKPEEYSNMSLSNIDVITNLGKDYDLNDDQLAAIADRVREDFGNKEPEDYTVFDLIALRQILCAFNRSEIVRIHPSAYKEAASVIGKIKRCSADVLQGFATLATRRDGFGPTLFWTNSTIEALGSVADFFPKDLITKIRNRTEI